MLFLLFVATTCFAAESITWQIYEFKTKSGTAIAQIISTITTAADGSVTTTILGGTSGGAGTKYDMRGKRLKSFCAEDNGTNPTDNSDLYLNQHSTTGKDVLGGAGVDLIDSGAGSNNCAYPLVGSDLAIPTIYGDLYQAISNNSADSAQIKITYNFSE